MAANARDGKRRYQTPGVVSGSLARQLDSEELERQLDGSGRLDFDQQYRQRKATEAELIARRRARAKAAVRPAQKVPPVMAAGFLLAAGLLVCLLLCYVQINTISGSIVKMKTEISRLEVEQVSLMTRHERAFDLSSVKAAAQAAGMSQPSESQIYYIDLPGQDQAVAHVEKETGVLSRAFTALSRSLSAAVEYFR